jgi:hypothetical protein
MDPQNRFPLTFYPASATLDGSQPIHLSEGQKVLNADIHVGSPMPPHPLKIRWDWAGEAHIDYLPPAVNVKPDKGRKI